MTLRALVLLGLGLTVACGEAASLPSAPAPDGGAPADGGRAEDGGPPADAGASDLGSPDAGGDCPGAGASAPGLVDTAEGPVRGVQTAEGWRWLGVPFAAPPTGDLRWGAPAPAACRETILEASSAGAECPQYAITAGRPLTGDEDCLTLNVWSPVAGGAEGAPLPVLFFVHGGGHEQGGGARAVYDGASLAADGAVVVTANYRLGPFGFLAHPDLDGPAGNYGMADQIAALGWVRDNIRGFGGDPERVLVFGQSAGAVSTCRLLVSPAARGLFHAAAMMSGACVATPRAAAEAQGRSFAERVGCAGADAQGCLRGLSTAEVMAGFDPATTGTNVAGRLSFDGVIDGELVPDAPRAIIEAGQHAQVPIIVGSTREENGRDAPPLATEAQYRSAVERFLPPGAPASFVEDILEAYPPSAYESPRDAYVALTSDVRFTCQARRDARVFAEHQTAPVYRHLFAHVPERGSERLRAQGAWHGIDLFFVFDTVSSTGLPTGPADEAVTDALQSAWRELAGEGTIRTVSWTAYDPSDERVLLLEGGARMVRDPKRAECDFWDQLLP